MRSEAVDLLYLAFFAKFDKYYKELFSFLLQGMTAAPSLSAAEAKRSRCGAAWMRGAWPPS
jgi:hypothetical protein